MGDFTMGGLTSGQTDPKVTTVSGRYSLRGAARNAPREVEFAFSAPLNWRASSEGALLWIQSESGFYFDFDSERGPYFVRSDHPGIVYRNPVSELYALQSLEACLRWRDMANPSRHRTAEHEGHIVKVYANPPEWGASSRIVTDVETGIVLQVTLEGAKGRFELSTRLSAVTEGVDTRMFSWHGRTRSFEGGHVRSLPSTER
jgi:hypothetical protein